MMGDSVVSEAFGFCAGVDWVEDGVEANIGKSLPSIFGGPMFMSMETSGILGVGRSSGRVDIFVLFLLSLIILYAGITLSRLSHISQQLLTRSISFATVVVLKWDISFFQVPSTSSNSIPAGTSFQTSANK